MRGRGRACVRRRGWDPSQKVAGPDEGQVDSMRLDLHRLVQEAACVDAVATYVDVAGFFLNVVKEDIKCKEISSIDAVHNRTMTLSY